MPDVGSTFAQDIDIVTASALLGSTSAFTPAPGQFSVAWYSTECGQSPE
jgi:hypothetical protein